MMTFKKWMEISTPAFGVTTLAMHQPETEHDPFVPDETHVQQAINVSQRIKGFFPAFRSVIKTNAILKAFWDALNAGLPKNGEMPFNYSKSDFLNDEIQQYIANAVGMPFDRVEQYSAPLKFHFIQMYNNRTGWDHRQQTNNWPGHPDLGQP